MYPFKHVYMWILNACMHAMCIIEFLCAYCINVYVFEDIMMNECVYVCVRIRNGWMYT